MTNIVYVDSSINDHLFKDANEEYVLRYNRRSHKLEAVEKKAFSTRCSRLFAWFRSETYDLNKISKTISKSRVYAEGADHQKLYKILLERIGDYNSTHKNKITSTIVKGIREKGNLIIPSPPTTMAPLPPIESPPPDGQEPLDIATRDRNERIATANIPPLPTGEAPLPPTDQASLDMTPYNNDYQNAKAVRIALTNYDREDVATWVNFCNPSYVNAQGDKETGQWKIHISFDPAKRDEAWKIIGDVLMESSLPIRGKIHTLVDIHTQPGKQIALMLNDASLGLHQAPTARDGLRKEWETLLSTIGQKLNAAEIGLDPRPINSDAEQAERKWDKAIPIPNLPSYFNYRTDSYTILEDDIFETISTTARPEDQAKMLSQTAYRKLPESQKHNPTQIDDPIAEFFTR